MFYIKFLIKDNKQVINIFRHNKVISKVYVEDGKYMDALLKVDKIIEEKENATKTKKAL